MIKMNAGKKNKTALKHIRNQKKLVNGAIRSALYKAGKDIEKEAKQRIIRGPKTGPLYKVAGRKSRVRASAPGQAPANRTGTLQRSIKFINQGNRIVIGAEAAYARFLELGTDKMAARPYLKRSIDNNVKNIREHITTEIIKDTKVSSR